MQQQIIDEKANFIFHLLENVNGELSFEASFKMAHKKLLKNRFILGIEKETNTEEMLLHICKQMDMPDEYLEICTKKISDANMLYFGFEGTENSCSYKVYLDFWDKITNELHSKSNKLEPVILGLGFKWNPLNNGQGRISTYTCYPLISVKIILQKLSSIYDHHPNTLQIINSLINYTASKMMNDSSFIYIEMSEENNGRISFDINLYKANLQIKEIYPFLCQICQHYSISIETFNLLYEKINTKIFGHLSGGIDREGKDFLTIYYEV
jgi:hypothetical protein